MLVFRYSTAPLCQRKLLQADAETGDDVPQEASLESLTAPLALLQRALELAVGIPEDVFASKPQKALQRRVHQFLFCLKSYLGSDCTELVLKF